MVHNIYRETRYTYYDVITYHNMTPVTELLFINIYYLMASIEGGVHMDHNILTCNYNGISSCR